MTDPRELDLAIQEMRLTAEGDVCSRSRVLDSLLDLRITAHDRTDVTDLVDSALADLPGRTMVPTSWWVEQLDKFEMVAINPIEPVG